MSKFCTLSSYIISERTTGSYNGLGDFLVEPKRLTLSPGKNPDKRSHPDSFQNGCKCKQASFPCFAVTFYNFGIFSLPPPIYKQSHLFPGFSSQSFLPPSTLSTGDTTWTRKPRRPISKAAKFCKWSFSLFHPGYQVSQAKCFVLAGPAIFSISSTTMTVIVNWSPSIRAFLELILSPQQSERSTPSWPISIVIRFL